MNAASELPAPRVRKRLEVLAPALVVAMFTALLPLGSYGAARTPGAFLESNGVVVMEVESAPLAGSWKKESDKAGYTGRGYFAWRGPNHFSQSQAGKGVLAYPIKITDAGKYKLAIRSRRDKDGRTGPEVADDLENDVWVRRGTSGSWIKLFMHGTSGWGNWAWAETFDFGHDNQPSAEFDLSAGEHVLQLSGRSKGFKIDRIVLYKGSTKPSNSEPQSAREGQVTIRFLRSGPVIRVRPADYKGKGKNNPLNGQRIRIKFQNKRAKGSWATKQKRRRKINSSRVFGGPTPTFKRGKCRIVAIYPGNNTYARARAAIRYRCKTGKLILS